MAAATPPTMLFVRDFAVFRGGHLKVFDYFNHVAASQRVRPLIYMTESSRHDATNPWDSAGIAPVANLTEADSYFVAGIDWLMLDQAGIDLSSRPVINLIQFFGLVDPNDFRYQFLKRRALRICVSEEMADAVRKTGCVNGDVVCIPNGMDIPAVTRFATRDKRHDVFIAGLKNKLLAAQVKEALAGRGLDVDISLEMVPRERFLARLAAARIALLLPGPVEAFGLFALEAMAVESAVVIPDCVGNRSFCRDDETCVVPPYDAAGLTCAVLALHGDAARQNRLIQGGLAMVRAHSIERERRQFLPILDSLFPP